MDFISDWKKNRLLKNQAQQDYQQARGSLHLNWLLEGVDSLVQSVAEYRQQISDFVRDLKRLERTRDESLRLALEHHIAHTRLNEIPGIGEKLAQEIVASVFQSRLADFRVANQLSGIGENKQDHIDQWIARYEGLIPLMLADDFPGKVEIVGTENPKIEKIRQHILKLGEKRDQLQTYVQRAEIEIQKLSQVNEQDFFTALIDPASVDRQAIDQFLQGVYPEWEPMPDWFNEIIQTMAAEGYHV